MTPKGNKARMIDAAERRRFVLELKRAGGTYREIADAARAEFGADGLPAGWDERYAYKDLRRELDRLRDEVGDAAADVRAVELARLDELHARLYPVALGTEQVPPDVRAVDRVLRIMERRAKLLGLDAAERVDVTSGDQPIRRLELILPTPHLDADAD